MATVEIEFNCMCVFVPDERAGVVHVLMPTTEGHEHHQHGEGGQPGDGVEQHVVHMLHGKLPPKGASMAGWALVLGEGGANGPADTTLDLAVRKERETIVDLSTLAARPVLAELVQDAATREVKTRITLCAGRLETAQAEATWSFGGQDTDMAFRATWRMEDVPEEALRWVPLAPAENPPVTALADLGPDEDGVFRFSIHHVPDRALPPDVADIGNLDVLEVRDHFRALYILLGIDDPDPGLLPQPPIGHIGKAHCGIAQASLAV